MIKIKGGVFQRAHPARISPENQFQAVFQNFLQNLMLGFPRGLQPRCSENHTCDSRPVAWILRLVKIIRKLYEVADSASIGPAETVLTVHRIEIVIENTRTVLDIIKIKIQLVLSLVLASQTVAQCLI